MVVVVWGDSGGVLDLGLVWSLGGYWLLFWMMMMMMMMRGGGGDVEVNRQVRMGGDPIKEVLKQAMLQHEVTFRNQVRELHRLYWTQKNLMREMYLKESKGHDRPTAPERKQPAEEKKASPMPSCATVAREVPNNGDCDLNLQLSADEFIRDAGREVGNGCAEVKGFACNDEVLSGAQPGKYKSIIQESDGGNGGGRLASGGSSSTAPNIIDLEEIVEFESNKESNSIGSYDLGTQTYAKEAMFGSRMPAPSASESLNHSSQDPGTNWPYAAFGERWPEDGRNSGIGLNEHVPFTETTTQKQQFPSRKPMKIDLNAPTGDECTYVSLDSLPIFPSPATSSSVHHGVFDEPNARSQPLSSWRESDSRCSKEISAALQSDEVYSASVYTRARNTAWLSCGNQDSHPCTAPASAQSAKAREDVCDDDRHEVENVGHVSDTDSPRELYCSVVGFSSVSNVDQGRTNVKFLSPNSSCDLGHKNAGLPAQQDCSIHNDSRRQLSTLTSENTSNGKRLATPVGNTNLPPSITRDSEDKQVREGSEEETVSSNTITRDKGKEDRIDKEVILESEADVIFGKSGCSSRAKAIEGCPLLSTTEESGISQIESLIANGSSTKHAQFTEAGDCGFFEENPCIPNPDSRDHIKEQKSQATRSDNEIFSAAEALMCISSENVMCNFDQYATIQSTDLEAQGSTEVPQYSADSFEAMTLMLSESNSNGCPTAARLTEEERGEGAAGVKLRRGRGIRDFQKDILPGLVSLSRHEICEDLHNIGYELRRNRSRNREDNFVPVRSQRSRRRSARLRF